MAFKSNDRTFEKVYGTFDKRDYFNAKGLAQVKIGNFERALQKNDKGAQQILDKFKGDMGKAKDYIIQVISDRKKEQAFNDYKAFKAAVDSIQKGKPQYGAVDLVKSRIHNSSQKYTIALYSALRNKKFTKWKDVHNDVDDLIGESVNEAYIVTYAKKKGEKPASAAFSLRGSALSFERDLKKDGYITMITQKKVKGVDEVSLSKLHTAAKKGSYPITIVVIQKGKVVHQETVSTPQAVPAAFNVLRKKYSSSDYRFSIEDRTGKVLHKEDASQIKKIKKQVGGKEVKFYDALSKVEKKLGNKYSAFLDKALKDLKMNTSKLKTNADKEEALFQLKEDKEPQIITQLRDVVKNGYKTLKDPKTGKRMKVDSYSASAITQVYDAINQSNKDRFVKGGLMGMQSMAFKVLKK